MAVAETEHRCPHTASRAIAEGSDHSSQLVPGDRRCSVTAGAIGSGRGPHNLSRDESRRTNLNDDVVHRCRRLGRLCQRHPGRSRDWSVNNRFHSGQSVSSLRRYAVWTMLWTNWPPVPWLAPPIIPIPQHFAVEVEDVAWSTMDRTAQQGLDQAMAARGSLVVAIDHCMPPEHPYPAQIAAADASVDFVGRCAPDESRS